MAKFKVAITRTETQCFIVKANSGAEAIDKLSDAWIAGDIELDDPELCDSDFMLIGRTDDKKRAVL